MIRDRKLQINIVTLIILCLGLCITSFAISYTMIKYEIHNNSFQTGGIDIDLNGGKPIIPEGKWLLEPGMTIEEDFDITNKGSWEVFYKLYFEEVNGKLGDALEITIYEKGSPETILLNGKISNLVDADQLNIAGKLESGQKQVLTARFHFPKNEGNEYKGKTLQFKMSAIAVQTKNNNPENPKFE